MCYDLAHQIRCAKHTFSGRCDITPMVCCSFGGHSTPQFLQCRLSGGKNWRDKRKESLVQGRCKSWTLDSGLDHGLDRGLDGGLDFGPDFGPKFELSFGLVIIACFV